MTTMRAMLPGKHYDFRVGVRWKKVRREVLSRDHHTCRYCGSPATTVDHVAPVVRDGERYDKANLVAACAHCNSSKGARVGLPKRPNTDRVGVFRARASIDRKSVV